jgi:hypothetical protein
VEVVRTMALLAHCPFGVGTSLNSDCSSSLQTPIMIRIVAVVAVVLALVEADGDCTGLSKTLTWECGGVCDEYIPCLVYNASDCESSSGEHSASCTSDGDGVCAYACFTSFYATGEAYLLILFGDSSRVSASESELNASAWVYEDAIASIGAPNINPVISAVHFVGGKNDSTIGSLGVPATVTLADGFRIDNDNVTKVEMSYIDLSHVDDLLSLLPDGATELTASGSGLTSFKAGEDQGLNLTSMYVDQGNMPIDAPLELTQPPCVLYRSLDYTPLTTFSGSFPELTYM